MFEVPQEAQILAINNEVEAYRHPPSHRLALYIVGHMMSRDDIERDMGQAWRICSALRDSLGFALGGMAKAV